MKKLIVIAHSNLNKSSINRRWIEELKKYPKEFTIHNLYSSYPDKVINVEKEQQLIEEHNTLILQYPLYWFNCPSLMKQWFDEVFLYGWAYGSKGDKLKDKKIALAISVGMKEMDYQETGKCNATIEDLILPFKTLISYSKATYEGCFTLYDSHNISNDALEESAKDYIVFLNGI